MTLDDLAVLQQKANIKAFERVIREKESSQDDTKAYRMIQGNGLMKVPPWVHPYNGISTTRGARACGAYQFLGTTWKGLVDAIPGGDFSPSFQDLRCVQLLSQKSQGLKAILNGYLEAAIFNYKEIWPSLPGGEQSNYPMNRAEAVFKKYGGILFVSDTN